MNWCDEGLKFCSGAGSPIALAPRLGVAMARLICARKQVPAEGGHGAR
ncbi:MAG: hypothetical protein AAF405_04170 [Pseudomonadota bacterium]